MCVALCVSDELLCVVCLGFVVEESVHDKYVCLFGKPVSLHMYFLSLQTNTFICSIYTASTWSNMVYVIVLDSTHSNYIIPQIAFQL